jgi:hypothetical protein
VASGMSATAAAPKRKRSRTTQAQLAVLGMCLVSSSAIYNHFTSQRVCLRPIKRHPKLPETNWPNNLA